MFFKTLLFLHIFFGGVSLVIGLFVVFLKKGDKIHKKIGLIFFYSLLICALLSLILAVFKYNVFLFIVGIFTMYMLLAGKRAIHIKSTTDLKKIDWILGAIMAVFGAAFLVYGFFLLVNQNSFGWVLIAFGTIGLLFVWSDFKIFRNQKTPRPKFLASHISKMMGAFIASLTAFFVTTNIGLPSIVAWLLPTLLFVPLIIKWIRQYAPKTKKPI